MKNTPRFFLALLTIGCVHAAPLTNTTAVHARPDESAPTIGVLNAGSEPTPAIGVAAALPSGWSAVELSGPFEVYVLNKDLNKSLDVHLGASFRLGPKLDSPVIATMEKGDVAELSGTMHGKWTQIRLQKKITGYVNLGPALPSATASSAPAASSPAPSATLPPPAAPVATHTAPAPFAPAPSAPAAYSAGGMGHPAQMVNLGDGGSSALPRLFEGKFVSTRRLLAPRRPYDFQLNDKGGERYAYLDISKLLQTEQIDKYVDHTVTIYGTAEPVPNSKDIVIKVESLQLH